jgi:hypothetical protein
MPKATQFTLSHEDRPGMLAHTAKVLGPANVNILACLTTTLAALAASPRLAIWGHEEACNGALFARPQASCAVGLLPSANTIPGVFLW